MFEGSRVAYATNCVIGYLVQSGAVDETSGVLMRAISRNRANRHYATAALKLGLVKCKFTAAATTFARLAVYFVDEPIEGITDQHWKLACTQALNLAGASSAEAEISFRDLINMNERVASQPPDPSTIFRSSSTSR